MKVNFKGVICKVQLAHYRSGGAPSIQLVLDESDPSVVDGLDFAGSPYAKITTNLDGFQYKPNEVTVKLYTEGVGNLEPLIAAKLLNPPHKHLDMRPFGFGSLIEVQSPDMAKCYVAVCTFTDHAKQEFPDFFGVFSQLNDPCDECGEATPVIPSGSMVNAYHSNRCSLFEGNCN